MEDKKIITIGVDDEPMIDVDDKETYDAEKKQKELKDKLKHIAIELDKIKHKTQITEVMRELNSGKTLDDIINEVKNKTSKMSSNTRDFVVTYKSNVILEWIDDLRNKPKQQHRINIKRPKIRRKNKRK